MIHKSNSLNLDVASIVLTRPQRAPSVMLQHQN